MITIEPPKKFFTWTVAPAFLYMLVSRPAVVVEYTAKWQQVAHVKGTTPEAATEIAQRQQT